jgi:hypothetical protein
MLIDRQSVVRAPFALSLAALVLVNLVPLVGVIHFGWRVFDVLALFWAENLIIGAITVFRMGALLVLRSVWAALFAIPFFIMHYGAFSTVHGVFVYAFFAPPDAHRGALSGLATMLLRPDDLFWPFLALCASHLVSFVVNFLRAGEYRRVELDELMMLPYRRIMLLHLCLIGGGMFAIHAGETMPALAALVFLKIVLDAWTHLEEHRRLQSARESAPEAASARDGG